MGTTRIQGRRSLFLFLCLPLLWCAACSRTQQGSDCNDPLGCVELAPGDPLKLGVIQSLSGSVAALGEEQVRGFELALERREGKLLGHEVLTQIEDTGCQPEGGANAALKITADPKVVAIFGTTCSSDASTASEVMSAAGMTMISGNNSAPFLTKLNGQRAPKWREGYFRTAPNEEDSGPAAAYYAFKKLGIRKAATINDGDIYTRGLTDGFAKKFTELGGKIVVSATVNKQDTNMGPVLTAVKTAQAKLVFFPLFQPEGNHVLLQARRDKALADTVFMSDGALIEQGFIDAVGRNAVGMYFVGPTPPTKSPALDKLIAQYKARFKTDPATYYYASAFDAAELLFTAIEKAAVPLPGGGVRIGRKALRNALYATREHAGMTGPLSCNEFGDCAAPRFNVLRLDDPSAGVDGLKANVQYTYAPKP